MVGITYKVVADRLCWSVDGNHWTAYTPEQLTAMLGETQANWQADRKGWEADAQRLAAIERIAARQGQPILTLEEKAA
jgi:hypothetical protein